MIAGLNLTDTKIADGQLSSAAPESDGADFAALLEPLSTSQGSTATGTDDIGDLPAQATADAEFADLEAAVAVPQAALEAATLDLEPLPEETLPASPVSAGPAMAAEDTLVDIGLEAAGGKPLPPTGNSLQQAASEPVAGDVPGLAPDPAIARTLRVDGQLSTRDLSPDSVALSQRPATAPSTIDPRAPLPVTDTPQLADGELPTQDQEFSARLASTGLAAANTTAAPANQANMQSSLAAAFADTDAGAAFTSTTSSETAGRVMPDSPAAERTLRLPIQQFAGQPGWGEEVRSNLQWLSRQGLHRAELQLHPAELGSIDVRITTENDQASVVFYAANRTARELLEAELPRLRELFSQVGVELTQADVAERQQDGHELGSGQQGFDDGHNSSIKESATGADNGNEAVGSLAVDASGAQNLIDYYI